MPHSQSVTTQEKQRASLFVCVFFFLNMVLALKGLRSDSSLVRDQIMASSLAPSLIDISAQLLCIGS